MIKLGVTGHRPNRIKGWEQDIREFIRSQIKIAIESQRRRDIEEWKRIRRMGEEREQNDEDEDLSELMRGRVNQD